MKGIALALIVAATAEAFAIAPFARFDDGMLSKTRPTGWLGEACRTQRNGLTGHPEALSYPFDSCLWAGKISRQGEHGEGWWRYEQTAYYVDGLLRLGYALGDAEFIAKGEKNVAYTLAHATPEGQLGDECLWMADKYEVEQAFLMWPMAVFFRVLKADFDATGDKRIPAALERYYRLYSVDQIRNVRNSVSIEGMLWTYERTGDRSLLEKAEQAWNRKEKTEPGDHHSLTPALCLSDDPIYMHGVSYSEELKLPLLLYAHTGKREYLDQALKAEAKMEKFHMLPDGCPSSVEETRGNCVNWGHETCDITDYTWTLGYFLETTGDGHYADLIERCIFNAGFGVTDNRFTALQYFSNLNQFISTYESDHNPYHVVGDARNQYRATHDCECCAGNVTRFLPNFVSRMFLRDRAGDPVAALYAPASVDFGWARIIEETKYPAEGRIRFRFEVRERGEHAFTFRVPGWCRSGAQLKVNGAKTEMALEAGKFATLSRDFADGDTVELDFPMEVRFEELPRRMFVMMDKVSKFVTVMKGPRGSQGTVVTRGPLLFAYAIPADCTEDLLVHPQMNGKKSANPAFSCWNLKPAAPFGYALAGKVGESECEVDADGGLFDTAKPAVTVEVPVKRIRWELENGKWTSDLPEEVEVLSAEVRRLKLIPYGATQLRLAVFPVVK